MCHVCKLHSSGKKVVDIDELVKELGEILGRGFSAVVMVPGVDDEVLDLFLSQTPIHRTVVDDGVHVGVVGEGLGAGHLGGTRSCICLLEIGVDLVVGYSSGGGGTGVEGGVVLADVDVHGNGNVATPILKLADVNPDPSLKVSAQVRYQGMACYEAYAAFIGDYTFATTFNVVVEKNNKSLKKTDQVLQYTLTIPAKYRQAGRSFRLLAIGSGVVPVYDDLDTSDSTITFATDEPTTAYALVYK